MYPVGTKCVITWDVPRLVHNIGEVVICGAGVWTAEGTYKSKLVQEVSNDKFTEGFYAHPIDWMLPIEPDTSIMDDMEDIKRLSDEILS